MQTRITPFGRAGWDERKRLVRAIIVSRQEPPFLYNDVLMLVSSARLKRRYGRLLLDALLEVHGARCLVQPEIQTLHQFIQQQYTRLSGPRLIDEQSRLVLLEGLVKERLSGSRLFSQSPDILAPSLSTVLAKTVEQLAVAGITPAMLSRHVSTADFADKPQVKLLQDVYTAYQQALRDKHLTDPAGVRHFLLSQFDPAWLDRYRMVVIDGIHDAEQVEVEILSRIAAASDCVLLVDAPSPALVSRAGQNHPLSMVREFLEGIGYSVGQDEQVRCDEPMAIAGALFSDEPFERTRDRVLNGRPFSGSLNLLSAINTREEVSLIARQVKESLGNGIAPDSMLVSFPALDEYAPLVEELFDEYGIPYNRALGRQLGTSAVATALISLLRAGLDDFPAASLLRVFSSPFLKYGENQDIGPAVDRFLRNGNITGGRQKLLAAARRASEDAALPARSIEELIAALDPFRIAESTGLSTWMDRLSDLLDWSGLGDRATRIKGPLNINLQAYRKLYETLLSLASAGRTFPEYRYTFSEWLFLLRKTLMHARFQVPPEDEGGVQVLGLEESLALPWNEIYLGGLTDTAFPQRLPQNIFLPEQALEAMGTRTLERARIKSSYHFYRLLLSAPRVTLSYPEQVGDRPVVPSPFLKELAPLELAGILNRGIAATSGLQFSLRVEDSRSMTDLAKALAMGGAEQERTLHERIAAMPEPRPETVLRIDALIASGDNKRTDQEQLPCPGSVQDFRVTDLDIYLACPYDYYITRVLGIEPLEEVSDDISPLERGSKVHAVLRDFYRTWKGSVTRENRAHAFLLLRDLAAREFSSDADTFRNRRTRGLFLTVMAERFLDAEIEFWTQGMKPAFLEQAIDGYPLLLSTGEQVRLSGKIDRIDADEAGNFVIVDYKTGKYPLPRKSGDQDIFQLPMYAVMARETLAGKNLIRPVGLAYYDLAGRISNNARDVVLFDRDAGIDHLSSKPNTSPKPSSEFQAILEQSLDKARSAVEGILAGKFPALPRDEGRCRFCTSQVLCRKDEGE